MIIAAEHKRLEEERKGLRNWKKWGPYLSERQWGTVREDYSDSGNSWDYFPHDQARSRTYRWGEDGLAGISDDKQLLCFALALWNGQDPIIKERLFGLTNSEGNHGEDVKEYYFYLDSTPTHSYMKYLYKYPQRAYPYDEIVATNRSRSRYEREYELIDTGVFDDNRYFDVFVEYAKQSGEDLLVKISVSNRGPETASLHLLPTLWYRNTWAWDQGVEKPVMQQSLEKNNTIIEACHPLLGMNYLYCEGEVELLFTENETNRERIFGQPNPTPYVKDAINNYLVFGTREAVNPEKKGTKVAAHYNLEVAAGETKVVKLRLTQNPLKRTAFKTEFDKVFETRYAETEEFYSQVIPAGCSQDEARVMRQALAGMLWSKQFYNYNLGRWLKRDPYAPDFKRRNSARNRDWHHLYCEDIISMPDKWEYPWFAAWDLAFHTIPLAMVDPDFAKHQLELFTESWYQHPNGQIPAYEWNFGDVNPPVHAWAAWRVYLIEKQVTGKSDFKFLKRIFQKLLLNFTWWVNRKDPSGNNVFEGGFLGLDNIGVFDRSAPLPTGGRLEQADGTAWMAMFCLDMLTISLELAREDETYEDVACKFYEHFLQIAYAMDRVGENEDELWDEEDGFYYDLLILPDGRVERVRIRSMVGLLALAANAVFTPEVLERLPKLKKRMGWYHQNNPEFGETINNGQISGVEGRLLFSVNTEHKLKRILQRMLDPERFLSDYGIRALSRWHKDNPYVVVIGRQEYRVQYEPAESSSGLFGGNSNWRGPIWMPVNMLLVESLLKLYRYYGDDFKVECPVGSGQMLTLWEVSKYI